MGISLKSDHLKRYRDLAALFMKYARTELGYPGLAIVCFLVAAGGGMSLVLTILWADHKHRQRVTRG